MDKQEYYHDKTGRFSAVDKLMMGHPEPIQAENLEVGVCIFLLFAKESTGVWIGRAPWAVDNYHRFVTQRIWLLVVFQSCDLVALCPVVSPSISNRAWVTCSYVCCLPNISVCCTVVESFYSHRHRHRMRRYLCHLLLAKLFLWNWTRDWSRSKCRSHFNSRIWGSYVGHYATTCIIGEVMVWQWYDFVYWCLSLGKPCSKKKQKKNVLLNTTKRDENSVAWTPPTYTTIEYSSETNTCVFSGWRDGCFVSNIEPIIIFTQRLSIQIITAFLRLNFQSIVSKCSRTIWFFRPKSELWEILDIKIDHA